MEKTDNEIIAEFMGIEVVQYVTHFWTVLAIVPEEGIIDWPELRTFNPDTDWNHLMPVVSKIRELYSDHIDELEWVNSIEHVTELPVKSDIGTVYDAVVTFITWYNANRKTRIGCTINIDQRGHPTQPKQNGN